MNTIAETDNDLINFIISFDGCLLWSIEDACEIFDISLDHAISALICYDREIRTLDGRKFTDKSGISFLKKKVFFMRSGKQ